MQQLFSIVQTQLFLLIIRVLNLHINMLAIKLIKISGVKLIFLCSNRVILGTIAHQSVIT